MTPGQALEIVEQFRLAWTGGNGRDHDLLREAVQVLAVEVNNRDDTRPSP